MDVLYGESCRQNAVEFVTESVRDSHPQSSEGKSDSRQVQPWECRDLEQQHLNEAKRQLVTVEMDHRTI